MDKSKEKELNAALRAEVQKIRDDAILVGGKVICGVVLSKAKDKKKDDHEKLKDIIAYCECSLGVADRHKDDLNG